MMRPRVVPLDGRALLLQVKDAMEADLRAKVEAVEVSDCIYQFILLFYMLYVSLLPYHIIGISFDKTV